jgi:quercetin dioxygenase-like cupin family protein
MPYTLSRLAALKSSAAIHEASEQTFNAEGCTMTLQALPPGLSKGGPRYHRHVEEQVLYVLDGEIDVLLASGAVRLKAGDVMAIPSNEVHGARRVNEGPLLMLNVFTPRRPADFTHESLKMYDNLADVP